jgi:branched-chain amino acid transport system ATP-binding protein
MAPLLQAESLYAGYSKVPVVRDINLHVGVGEVVALLGTNGAGKTTTLRTLLGALPALDGAVRWKGDVTTSPFHKRVAGGIGYVPEGRGVFMQMTVGENLRVGRGTVRRAVELFPQLEEHLKRKAGDLSGGQQQMLSLARVLASEPEVIVVDELSLGLAPIIVRHLLAALTEAAGRGAGVILVEQHAELALEIADRVYVFRRGRIVGEGPASEFRGRFDELHRLFMADDEPVAVG